jgi:uridine phosphorylase
VILGDGSETRVPVYRVAVRWHGRFVSVLALEMEGGALLGMALLRGSHVAMDVVGDGQLRIEPIGEP